MEDTTDLGQRLQEIRDTTSHLVDLWPQRSCRFHLDQLVLLVRNVGKSYPSKLGPTPSELHEQVISPWRKTLEGMVGNDLLASDDAIAHNLFIAPPLVQKAFMINGIAVKLVKEWTWQYHFLRDERPVTGQVQSIERYLRTYLRIVGEFNEILLQKSSPSMSPATYSITMLSSCQDNSQNIQTSLIVPQLRNEDMPSRTTSRAISEENSDATMIEQDAFDPDRQLSKLTSTSVFHIQQSSIFRYCTKKGHVTSKDNGVNISTKACLETSKKYATYMDEKSPRQESSRHTELLNHIESRNQVRVDPCRDLCRRQNTSQENEQARTAQATKDVVVIHQPCSPGGLSSGQGGQHRYLDIEERIQSWADSYSREA